MVFRDRVRRPGDSGEEWVPEIPPLSYLRIEVNTMEFNRLRLPFHVKHPLELKLKEGLRKNYPFVIEGIKGILRDSLKLEKFQRDDSSMGELFIAENGVLLYYIIPEDRSFMEIGGLFDRDEGENLFQGFKDTVRSIFFAEAHGPVPEWRIYTPVNINFSLLRGEAHPLQPTEEDLGAVQLLKDAKARSILRDIEKVHNCFLDDILKEHDRDETLPYIERLIDQRLINREFIVFCRMNNMQISRVANISAITEASQKGLKCPFCERIFSDERIDQALSCTPFGRKMTKPNFWLALYVLQTLEARGISTKNILVKEEKNFRIFDILVNQEHHLILIEVKDTPSSLDEIYLFHSRIKFYKPDVAVFLSTAPLKREVNMYLSKHTETPIILIEGLEGLDEKLHHIFSKKLGDYIKDVLSSFEPYTSLNMGRLFSEYFLNSELASLYEKTFESGPVELEKEEEAESVPQVAPSAAHPEAAAVEEAPAEKAYEEEEAEEEATLIEEIIPTTQVGFIGMEEEPYREAVEEKPEEMLIEEKPLEDFIPPAETETMEEAMAEQVQEQLPPAEEQIEEEEAAESTAETEMAESYMLEEHFESQYQPEVATMEAQAPDRLTDEARESLVRRMQEDIAANGIAGRRDAVDEMLREFSAINGYSASIVSSDGYEIIQCLEGGENQAELLNAFSMEIFRNTDSSFTEAGFLKPGSLFIRNAEGRIFLYPLGENLLLIYEPLKAGIDEDDTAGLPGEMELRDIIMKKVLEDLGRLEGVVGNIVASRDGLSIDFIFNDEGRDIDLLSSVGSQIIVDNEKYLARLGLGELKQMMIFTEDSHYSLIPLTTEGILISVLDPHVPRELWKTTLLGSATMIASVFQ